MKKRAKKPTPPSIAADTFAMSVNGVRLLGEKHGGVWRWSCPRYPMLVHEFDGLESPRPMLAAFLRAVMADMIGCPCSAVAKENPA